MKNVLFILTLALWFEFGLTLRGAILGVSVLAGSGWVGDMVINHAVAAPALAKLEIEGCVAAGCLVQRRRQRGFTLVEMSIVLVIIGLIIGGIFVGKDMIHNTQLLKIVTQEDQFIAAIQTFQGKYNCIPGDCTNATQFFGNAVNGNGNGIIEWGTGLPSEGINMWNQLSEAGLITGNFSPAPANTQSPILFGSANVPLGPLNNGYYMVRSFSTWNTVNGIIYNTIDFGQGGIQPAFNFSTSSSWLMYGTVDNSVPFMDGALNALDAQSIDSKTDDGMPLSGHIGSADSTNGNGCIQGSYGDVDYPTHSYNSTNSGTFCILLRKIN